jgi:hypothetical protein
MSYGSVVESKVGFFCHRNITAALLILLCIPLRADRWVRELSGHGHRHSRLQDRDLPSSMRIYLAVVFFVSPSLRTHRDNSHSMGFLSWSSMHARTSCADKAWPENPGKRYSEDKSEYGKCTEEAVMRNLVLFEFMTNEWFVCQCCPF